MLNLEVAETKSIDDGRGTRSSAFPSVILGAAIALFAAALCVNPSTANDLFWQLRAGHDIVATGSIPHVDHFSWTRYGHPWVAHEWGSFVLLWLAYAATGGYAGVWLLQTALVVLTVSILFAALQRETHAPITTFILCGWATIVCSAYFEPRPQLLTYLFLTILLLAIQAVRRDHTRARTLWLLVPMCLVWANLHAGVIVGVVILALFAAGEAVDAVLARRIAGATIAADDGSTSAGLPTIGADFRLAATLTMVALACAAATLITPYDWRVYHNFFDTVTNATAMSRVNEWASPNFHEPFGRMLEYLAAILFVGAIASRRKGRAGEFFVVLLLLSQTLYAGRNAPLFAIAATIIWAGDVQSGITSLLAMLQRKHEAGASLFGKSPPFPVVAALAVMLVVVSAARIVQKTQHGATGLGVENVARASFELRTCPDRACRFLTAERFPTGMHLYNAYGDGGYLIWRVPQYPVFIDGRADVYFGRVLDDYARLNKLPFDWRETVDRYGIDVAFLTTRELQARAFLAAPDWALVYADRSQLDDAPNNDAPVNALIFVRRSPNNSGLIARCRRDCAAMQDSPEKWSRYAGYPALR